MVGRRLEQGHDEHECRARGRLRRRPYPALPQAHGADEQDAVTLACEAVRFRCAMHHLPSGVGHGFSPLWRSSFRCDVRTDPDPVAWDHSNFRKSPTSQIYAAEAAARGQAINFRLRPATALQMRRFAKPTLAACDGEWGGSSSESPRCFPCRYSESRMTFRWSSPSDS